MARSTMTDETKTAKGKMIRIARVIPAAPAHVWQCWTTPAVKKKWWGRTEKATLDVCDLNIRVGGRFHYGMRLPGCSDTQTADGEFLEVNISRQLVFTWSARGGVAEVSNSKASVEFTDLGDGSTRVSITHEGLPPSAVAMHQAGWSDALQDLAAYCAG
jgi:uncharacterized protein YndB with AHSA1/START domain